MLARQLCTHGTVGTPGHASESCWYTGLGFYRGRAGAEGQGGCVPRLPNKGVRTRVKPEGSSHL